MKELLLYGKANKVLEAGQFEAEKKAGIHEEVNVDSSLYNKELLRRALDKTQNEDDTRKMIKRSFDRDPIRK